MSFKMTKIILNYLVKHPTYLGPKGFWGTVACWKRHETVPLRGYGYGYGYGYLQVPVPTSTVAAELYVYASLIYVMLSCHGTATISTIGQGRLIGGRTCMPPIEYLSSTSTKHRKHRSYVHYKLCLIGNSGLPKGGNPYGNGATILG